MTCDVYLEVKASFGDARCLHIFVGLQVVATSSHQIVSMSITDILEIVCAP
jgi:hypothetical protein